MVVSEYAASVDDGITSGKRPTNSPATASAMVDEGAQEAQPSRPARAATSPPTSAARRATKSTAETAVPVLSWVHTRKTTASTAATAPMLQGQRAGPVPDVAVGLERQEQRAVGGEEGQRDQPAEQAERVEQGEEVAGELLVGVDRHPGHDVGEGDAPQEGGHRPSR